MFSAPLTKLDIAKTATSMIVAGYTAKFLNDQVESHTSMDADSVPVKVSCYVGGELVAMKLRPHTDKFVEYVDARLRDWKLRKKLDDIPHAE